MPSFCVCAHAWKRSMGAHVSRALGTAFGGPDGGDRSGDERRAGCKGRLMDRFRWIGLYSALPSRVKVIGMQAMNRRAAPASDSLSTRSLRWLSALQSATTDGSPSPAAGST
jgi:hypothetical protein